MKLFLEISGAMFWTSLLGGGAWIGACLGIDAWRRWKLRVEFRTFPNRPHDDEMVPVNFGGELVLWHPKTVRVVQRAIAQSKAVEARRAQEAGASSRGERPHD